MPQKITTVLFDLDGTLIDSEAAAARCVHGCFGAWGITIHPDDASFITGRTWATAFDFLFSKYTLPVSAAEAAETIMRSYRDSLETELCVVPGGADAVRALAGHFRLGLVSGSGRKEILWALDKLEIRGHFQVILGAEDYPRSKPAPDGYLQALSHLKAKPEEALVFEDSTAGIASAIAAGTRVVAITGTNHFRQDTSRAHHHIPDLTPVDVAWIHALSQRMT